MSPIRAARFAARPAFYGGKIMSTGAIIGIIVAVLVLCCCFTHRRVIKALIQGKPMPKAPKWHVWVKPENRRK